MQGIYNYKPETNHISRVYSVAAGMYLQFMLHVILLRSPALHQAFEVSNPHS